jgi:uncharacterized protein
LITPTADNQPRIDALDILRGFALSGLMFMNIEWFNRSHLEFETWDTSLTGIDHAVGWLIKCFIEGKFYALFALLFGMGFAIMISRSQSNDTPFAAIFTRRMLALFAFGVCHLLFVWEGDILQSYAISGLMFWGVVSFLNGHYFEHIKRPELYIKVALWWLAIPLIISVIAALYIGVTKDYGEALQTSQINEQVQFDADVKHEIETLSNGTFIEATKLRFDRALLMIGIAPFMALYQFIPIFLIGYWLIVSGIMQRYKEHAFLFLSLKRVGLGLGVLLTVFASLFRNHPEAEHLLEVELSGYMLFVTGQYLMTAGYFGLIMSLLIAPKWQTRLSFLAPFGRMALSNYLLQCIILSLLFYGYGLAWYGEVGRASQMWIVLAILLIQIPLSALWLRTFAFGPFEWFWRCLTYKEWVKLRHKH